MASDSPSESSGYEFLGNCTATFITRLGLQFNVLYQGHTTILEKNSFEVLVMVKQLGIQTFSLTLSCTDLQCNKLIGIISKLNSLTLTDDDIKNMSYQ